jgi:tetratricopeptide (TPR) repeat protein
VSAERPPLPNSYEGLLQRARTAYRAADLRTALDLYQRLVERLGRLNERILARRPELEGLLFEARSELASILEAEGRYAEAIEVKEALLAGHPEAATGLRRDIAQLRVARGEVETGLAELHALAEEQPDDAWTWIAIGFETRVEGRFAQGQAALDRALQVCQQDDARTRASIHYQRFLLFEQMGQLDDAMAAWNAAADADPEVVRTIGEVSTMLADAGRYSEALQYVDRNPNELQAGFQRGLIASRTGNAYKARTEWEKVAHLEPATFEYGYESWTEAVLRVGDADEALTRLRALLARYVSPRLLTLSGIAWAMKGDAGLAASLFQQAIDLTRRSRPPKQKLDSKDWHLLDSLVADDAIKRELRPYFAVIETLWGSQTGRARSDEGPILPPLHR